jgi:adenine deaminase
VIDHTGETTAETRATLPARDGLLAPDTEADVLPAAVIERHGGDGGVGTGFVHGFGLDRGAIASTVSHDAHNLVVVGATHEAMVAAATRLRAVGGGLVAYDPAADEREDDGTTTLPLPVAGLLSPEPASRVAAELAAVDETARAMGLALPGGVMELDNLALEVIPELRLSNRGLVDVRAGEIVDVVVG